MSTRFITSTHLYIVTRDIHNYREELKAPTCTFTFKTLLRLRHSTRDLLRDCEALVVTDTRHGISRSGLLGPRLALQPDAHVVGVPLLAPVAEAGVELGHGVRAVEGHLVAAQPGGQGRGEVDRQLAELLAAVG